MSDYQWLSSFVDKIQKNMWTSESLLCFQQAKKNILDARGDNGVLYFFGNGASNTIASHSALDFSNQIGIRCFSFNDPSIITAYSNDFGYDVSMDRFVKLFAQEKDICVFISSSGESKNIIQACETSKSKNIKTITLTGFESNNQLNKLGDINFWASSNIYNVVESIHFLWLATLCDFIIKDEMNKIGKHGRNL